MDDNMLIFVNFSILRCCYFSRQWALQPIFADFETYSRQNSNQILEMTSGFQPVTQTAVFKQFALHRECVSSEKISWTCVCLWQHVCLLHSWLNILMQTFHCFHFWLEVSEASRQIACGFPLIITSISLKCQWGMHKHMTPRLPLSHWMHLHDVTLFDLN